MMRMKKREKMKLNTIVPFISYSVLNKNGVNIIYHIVP